MAWDQRRMSLMISLTGRETENLIGYPQPLQHPACGSVQGVFRKHLKQAGRLQKELQNQLESQIVVNGIIRTLPGILLRLNLTSTKKVINNGIFSPNKKGSGRQKGASILNN